MSRLSLCLVMGFSLMSSRFIYSVKKEPKVLLIGIDGVRTDALKKASTPSLDRLIAKGVFIQDLHILSSKPNESDTLSGPGWANILTGVWPDKHKVKDNRFTGHNLNQYPHFFEYLKKKKSHAITASLVSWEPISHYIVKGRADIDIVETSSLTENPTPAELNRIDYRLTKKAMETVGRTDQLSAMFMYYHQVDAVGHSLGFDPENALYVKAIENVDDQVGKLLQVLESRKTYQQENWLILVCTDHGGWNKHHSQGHFRDDVSKVFLILSGASVDQKASIKLTYHPDITATILKHLSVELPSGLLDGKAIALK